ncbi:MAG: methionine--tRNA ligase [SAR324 cluster bacterium]|nr:methionine--tRNA ligase [SAR324 cluster bacterium]
MSKIFYITTPIFYANSHPHIGHAYTTIVSDIFRRFRKLFGEDTYFLTGTDEHGQKIAEAAKNADISPLEFVDQISQEFREIWPELHVEHDQFIRTTDPKHKDRVQKVLQKIYDQGEIYLREYEGLYCVGCERFLDEDELVEGLCQDHQVAPQHYKEENYFFKMSAYQDWLIQTIQENDEWIYPKRYRNEVLQFLNEPLQDLCISRPKSRLTWGIELPFDSNFVTYVWFDALLNYPNALGWPDEPLYQKYWPHVHHMIGKDILKTHAVYWPCMLKAAGIPIFQKLTVHGFWISSGSKMSKTVGNVIDPLAMKDRVGVDPLRYFLARDMSFGEDANFTEELLLVRYNGDLANNIGNLISRSISMSRKNFNNQVPYKGNLEDLEKELHSSFVEGIAQVNQFVLEFNLHRALAQIALMSSLVNKYIDETAPWKLAKEENARERLGSVLYTALDMVRLIVQLLAPVMPEKMKIAWESLGYSQETLSATKFEIGLLPEGQALPQPSPLFPKIKELTETPTPPKEPSANNSTPSEFSENQLTIEEFSKVELKVGKIVACENVKKSKKLLHSQVDLGEGRLRSIVSGIAECYKAEDLVGRQVIVVSNLKPAKLRGVLSEGMILCTDNGQEFSIVEPHHDALPGTTIR